LNESSGIYRKEAPDDIEDWKEKNKKDPFRHTVKEKLYNYEVQPKPVDNTPIQYHKPVNTHKSALQNIKGKIEPTFIICPACNYQVTTTVIKTTSKSEGCCCFFTTIGGFPICLPIPWNCPNETCYKHYCPNCDFYIGKVE
jgi:hypothetical protein